LVQALSAWEYCAYLEIVNKNRISRRIKR
jgi:hypothetical protein